MKKTLILLVLLGFCFIGYTKSYLIIDKVTKEVFTISNKDDTVVPKEKEKIVLKDNLEDLDFSNNPTNYFYKNNKFIKNIEKISNLEIEREEVEKKNVEEKLISDRMRKIARDQLIAEGIINE